MNRAAHTINESSQSIFLVKSKVSFKRYSIFGKRKGKNFNDFASTSVQLNCNVRKHSIKADD